MNTIKKIALVAALGLSAGVAQAATCTTSSFTITTMSNAITGTPVSLPGPISATSCAGVFDGNNDQGGLSSPNPNLGYAGDGLMNGGTFKEKVGSGQFVDKVVLDPLTFLVESDLLDLKGDGTANDPGWILLGNMDGSPGKFNYYDKPFDISKALSFKMECPAEATSCTAGTWKLTLSKNILELLQGSLLNRSFFDHLAFVVKAGSGNGDKDNGEKGKSDKDKGGDDTDAKLGGWAVYDFDFNKLLAQAGGSLFSLDQPYSFTGTWNTKDFGNKQISHMSLWARDPLSTNQVSEPATLAMLGIGLLAAGFATRRRS